MISKSSSNFAVIQKTMVIIIWLVSYLATINIIANLEYFTAELQAISFILDWIGIILFLYVMFSWRAKAGCLFNPYNIFFLFFFLFNYGQPSMWALGIHTPTEMGSSFDYTQANIVKTQVYTLFSMFSFHVGALLVRDKETIDIYDKSEDIKKSIFIVGIIIGIIAIPGSFYRIINFFFVSLQYGYKALYYSSHASQGGLTMIIEMFFMPSLICILIGSGYNKKVMRGVYFIFGLYLLINLLAGDRGSWIYKLFVFVWLHSIFVKPINLKKFFKYMIVSIVGLNIVAVFTSMRNDGLQHLNVDYISDFMFGHESPIINNIFEMGGSMKILARLISDSGVREAWVFGNTYLAAFFGVISTRALAVLGLDFVLVDNWFAQDYLHITWGTGFSMIGEAYLNAGPDLAPIIMIILGFFIGSLLYVNDKADHDKTPLKYVFVATSLATFIGFSRGTIYLYFKTWFYGTLCTCIIILLFHNLIIKRIRRPI